MLLAGPTASGKSALAVRLAQALDGVVINADASQIYADLAILSARPTLPEMAGVPHRLFGVRDGARPCSAADWAALAEAEITTAWDAGRVPILVGGTGLYLRALLDGLADVPPIPSTIREAVRALATPDLQAALETADPVMAARLNANDRQRQARALEVVRATGQSLGHFHGAAHAPLTRLGADPIVRLLLLPPRATVYARCDARLARMLEAGALEEVRTLLARGLDPALPVMKAVGVRELAAVLAGDSDEPAALAAAQQATRHYAKRQFTWFRNQFNGWAQFENADADATFDELAIKLREYGLTLK